MYRYERDDLVLGGTKSFQYCRQESLFSDILSKARDKTDKHKHTDIPDKSDFRKPGVLAC